jgi:hypothetical protein
MFYHTYGDSAEATRELLRPFPQEREDEPKRLLTRQDVFMMSFVCAPVKGSSGVVRTAQASYGMLSALVAINVPLHLR